MSEPIVEALMTDLLTVNQARARFGQPPLPPEIGDKYWSEDPFGFEAVRRAFSAES